MKPQYRKVNTPTVLQMEAMECGVASLAMILGYYERYIPLETLRVDCGVSRDGITALNVVEAGKKHGFDADGARKTAEEVLEVEFPAIILWGPAHYVVLEGFSKDRAYLNDPARGKRAVTYEEFQETFFGIVLTFTKNHAFKKAGVKPRSFPQRVVQYLKEIPGPFTFLLLTSACLLCPALPFPPFYSYLSIPTFLNSISPGEGNSWGSYSLQRSFQESWFGRNCTS